MRKTILVLALVMVAAAAIPAQASARAVQACSPEDMETLKVDVRPVGSTYRRGDVVAVTVVVKRDPQRLAPEAPRPIQTSSPVEGAAVAIGIADSFGHIFGDIAETDASGTAVLDVVIPRYATAGAVDASVYAHRDIAAAPCAEPRETGEAHRESFFSIRR